MGGLISAFLRSQERPRTCLFFFSEEEVCFSVDWDSTNCSILTVSGMLRIMKLWIYVRVASIFCLNACIVCIYIIGIIRVKSDC